MRCAIVSVRNPALTFLSLARAMARIASANYPEDEALCQRMSQAIEADDFSPLDGEDTRHFGFHAFIGHPDVQKKLWGELAETLGAEEAERPALMACFGGWQDFVAGFAGTQAHEVHTLPKILREPLEFHRVGWPSLQGLVECMQRAGTRYAIVDSTDLQLDPGYFLPRLGEFIRANIGAAEGPRVAPKFHPGSVGTTSGMLYERVSQTSAIEPPNRSPIPADRLPPPYRRQLGHAYKVYLTLLRDTQRLRSSRESSISIQSRPIIGGMTSSVFDPTFTYCSVSLEEEHRYKECRLAQIRRDYPQFIDYFREIDKALVERELHRMYPERGITSQAS